MRMSIFLRAAEFICGYLNKMDGFFCNIIEQPFLPNSIPDKKRSYIHCHTHKHIFLITSNISTKQIPCQIHFLQHSRTCIDGKYRLSVLIRTLIFSLSNFGCGTSNNTFRNNRLLKVFLCAYVLILYGMKSYKHQHSYPCSLLFFYFSVQTYVTFYFIPTMKVLLDCGCGGVERKCVHKFPF
jgi:hypothetical protein